MQLKVVRHTFTDRSTIGSLYVDGQFECYTLEDVVRPEKIYGETAIPAGQYGVVINVSQRFKRRLPLLLNVPNYEGVRIHPGNKPADTLGCILVGQTKSADFIGSSVAAFDKLMPRLEAAAASGIVIELTEDRGVTRGRRRAASTTSAPPAEQAADAKTPAKKATSKTRTVAGDAATGVPGRKTAATKTATQKAAAKKAPAKKAPTKKASAQTATVKRAPAKRAPAKKGPAKKAMAAKAVAPRAPAKKSGARSGSARKPGRA